MNGKISKLVVCAVFATLIASIGALFLDLVQAAPDPRRFVIGFLAGFSFHFATTHYDKPAGLVK